MVEELSGVTQAWHIKVCRGDDKIQTDTVILTFNTSNLPSRICAGYLTLDIRPTFRSRCTAVSANAVATARQV
ncbi:hypothetical protein PoB_007169700 [Plakobranchus ocellatus]|uniref:Uncharacterized protein n=1 Tax=Plakobranchus ocellatus TaxID=259542 RepID=A0AAV4DLQ4_9GAST|nr:hypothetical protein PoB_007169700 [Plakobranchus ocellatus]